MSSRIYWSIGIIPVQDFISEATRSRDLKAGSVFLSWVMLKLINKIKTEIKTEVTVPILPVPIPESFDEAFTSKEFYGIPNRATGCIESNDLKKTKEIFDGLQKIVNGEWEILIDDILEKKRYVGNQEENKEYWKNISAYVQKAKGLCPIQVVWAIQVIGVDSNGVQEIEKLYTSVKRTRPINPYPGAPVGKCNQCGKREAIGKDSTYLEWNSDQKYLVDKNEYCIAERERLCPVCLVKRLIGYSVKDPFPSTSEIASRVWRKDKDVISKLKPILKDKIKGDDIYPYLYKRTINNDMDDIELRKKTLKILDSYKTFPSNYLSVITFDGDSMGKTLSNYPDKVPVLLDEFGKDLKQVIKNNDGEAFYIGGDEGLVLCPKENTFLLAFEVHKLWNDKAKDSKIDPIPTLSMGMTYFDRERPLSGAIQLAREAMEQHAKKMEGKDSLAIGVQTASGNEYISVEKWDDWEKYQVALNLINEDKLSKGWAYDVEEFLKTIPQNDWNNLIDAVRERIKGITIRRLNPKILNKDEMFSIWKDDLKGDTWWGTGVVNMKTVAHPFHLVSFLTRSND